MAAAAAGADPKAPWQHGVPAGVVPAGGGEAAAGGGAAAAEHKAAIWAVAGLLMSAFVIALTLGTAAVPAAVAASSAVTRVQLSPGGAATPGTMVAPEGDQGHFVQQPSHAG